MTIKDLITLLQHFDENAIVNLEKLDLSVGAHPIVSVYEGDKNEVIISEYE